MKKGLLHVMLANLISMGIGLAMNFVLPALLPISTYAEIKTFGLYISYAGFFSLGYNDGMYLEFGGKTIRDLDSRKLRNNIYNYIFIEIIAMVVTFLVGALVNNWIILAFAVGMFSSNILGYLKSFYQATGNFKLYAFSVNSEKILIFLLSVFFLICGVMWSWPYVWIQIIIELGISVYLFFIINRTKNFQGDFRVDIEEIRTNVSSGIVLMIGNFSNGLFTGLDRWFVKYLMSTEFFAYYSYAVTMESIVNMFFSPITITMYNYFCRDEITDDKIRTVKKMALIWGMIVISMAFPAKWILLNYIPKFTNANSVVFILFAAQVFYLIIKGIYVNIYKANKKQKKYLCQIVVMIAVGAVMNVVFWKLLHSMRSFALATLITAFIWLLVCEIGYKNIRYTALDLVGIIIVIVSFLLLGELLSPILGFILYLVICVLISLLFWKNEFIVMTNMLMNLVIEKVHVTK